MYQGFIDFAGADMDFYGVHMYDWPNSNVTTTKANTRAGGHIEAQFGKIHNMDASIQYSQLLFSLKYINAVKTTKKVLQIRELEIDKSDRITSYNVCYTKLLRLIIFYWNTKLKNQK